MNRKNKILVAFTFAALSIGAIGGATCGFLTHKGFSTIANDDNYSINLNSGNQVTDNGAVNLKTQLGNDVEFTYSGVQAPNVGDHVHLAQDGHITNSDHILSILSVTVNFSGSLEVSSSYYEGEFDDYETLVSGEEHTFSDSPYYLDLFAKDGECFITSAKIKFSCSSNPSIENVVYSKVTNASDITSGKYMVVYESSKYAMNATVDADNNYISVDNTGGTITYTDALANAVLTYDADNHTLVNSQGKYVGGDSGSNSLKFTDNANTYSNTLSYSSDAGHVTCNGREIRFNNSAKRFRYYLTTSQSAVQLYKTNARPVYAKSISLSMDSTTLSVGDEAQITINYNPSNTNQTEQIWDSSNEAVATVSDTGYLTAVGVGTTTITCMVETKTSVVEATIDVTVNKIDVTNVTLNETSLSLVAGGATSTLVTTVEPTNATDKSINWTSSNEAVATVSSGVVHPISEGSAVITATSVDNPSAKATCNVTVTSKPITYTLVTSASGLVAGDNIVFACNTQSVVAGQINGQILSSSSATFSSNKSEITTLPNDALELELGGSTGAWTFSNGSQLLGATAVKKLAFGSGTTTWSISISSGTATITNGTSSYGSLKYNSDAPRFTTYASGQNDIQIYSKPVADVEPDGISFADALVELHPGAHKQLSVTYSPANANTNLGLSWESSDEDVATVNSSGLVTVSDLAVADQTATITARLTHYPSITAASITIKVTEPEALSKTIMQYNYSDYNAQNFFNVDNCPTTGNPKLLIIPVWFTDSSTYISTSKKAAVKSDIETVYLGTEEQTGWHSVSSFYKEESLNKMNLNGVVTDWYECGNSSSYFYTDGEDNEDSRVVTLLNSAVTWYFNKSGSDSRQSFDTDGNGYLDGVMLIYAAPDYSVLNNNNASNLWAYCYWAQDTSKNSKTNPGENVFFWASYDFMYDSTKANERTGYNYANGDCSHCTLDAHTFIHEMGHVLGVEDYYDYGNNGYCPAGGFSMQDYNVGGHDPYSVMAYGWADPYIPTESMEITIGDFQSTHDLILLTPQWNEYDSPFDEYLLLELYTPTGLNELDATYQYDTNYPYGPSIPGIRLWHVDARLIYLTSSSDKNVSINEITTNPYDSKAYSVYHAFSNTYDDDEHGTYLGSSYYNYDILHLIRRNTSTALKTKSTLSSADLFVQGSSFTFSNYSSQFPRSTMNNGLALGWTFTVTSLSSTSATISLTRL